MPDAALTKLSAPAPRYVKIALIVSVLLFLILAQRSFIYVPDDAFITFRYSRNLADGFGPVFNPAAAASDRAEGYSCPLYMIVMAIVFKLPLGLDALLRAKFFGILCGIGVLFAASQLASRLRLPGWAIAAAPVLLAAHAGISISSVDGMETVFAALLMTLAALSFVAVFDGTENEKSASKTAALCGLQFAACAWNRPEGVLAGLLAAGVLVFGRRKRWGRAETGWLLSFVLPTVALFLMRRAFYGVWLPNTYYAKIAPLEDAVFKGLTYLMRTFFFEMNESPVLLVIGAAWWCLAIVGASGERMRRFPALAVALMAGGQAVFALRSGGDWMGGWRYMNAALPLLMLLSLAGIAEISGVLYGAVGKSAARATAGGLCAAILAACLFGQRQFWRHGAHDGYVSWASKHYSLNQRELLSGWKLERALIIADWLTKNAAPGSVAAYSEMGVTPFFAPKINFLDVDGLTDHGIATLPGAKHGQIGVESAYLSGSTAVGAYLKNARKPDYVLCGTEQDAPPTALDGAYFLTASFPVPTFAGEARGETTAPKAATMGVWKRN